LARNEREAKVVEARREGAHGLTNDRAEGFAAVLRFEDRVVYRA